MERRLLRPPDHPGAGQSRTIEYAGVSGATPPVCPSPCSSGRPYSGVPGTPGRIHARSSADDRQIRPGPASGVRNGPGAGEPEGRVPIGTTACPSCAPPRPACRCRTPRTGRCSRPARHTRSMLVDLEVVGRYCNRKVTLRGRIADAVCSPGSASHRRRPTGLYFSYICPFFRAWIRLLCLPVSRKFHLFPSLFPSSLCRSHL